MLYMILLRIYTTSRTVIKRSHSCFSRYTSTLRVLFCNSLNLIFTDACTSKNIYWSILIIVQRDATQSSLFIILQVHSTCFGCQPHPSSGVHKIVTIASGTGTPSNVAKLATLEGSSCTKNMSCAGGCSYSFVYTRRWVWSTPETCRVSLQNNK